MSESLNEAGRDFLFRTARTHNTWLDRPVSDGVLRELYDLLKWGPTSANTTPMRVLFLRSQQAKERLQPALAEPNRAKTMAAPVTAIIAYDLKFFDQMPKLFPHNPRMRDYFTSQPHLIGETAQRNSAIQGGYFILAARAVGLDCGPMSGFNNAKVDEEFFAKDSPLGGDLRSNFLCNLGYGDPAQLSPRNPRLDFNEACAVL
jgi:3-hydroxypropanoate dehydrogenase